MDARRVIATIVVAFSLLLLVIATPSTLSIWIAILLIVALAVLLVPPISRPYWKTGLLIVWAGVTGLATYFFITGFYLAIQWILETQGHILTLPYSREILAMCSLVGWAVLGILVPIISVVVAESVLERKWLWGVFISQLSSSFLLYMLSPGWEWSLETIATASGVGLLAGCLTFLAAEWLAGFNVRDFSYVEGLLPESIHNVGMLFRKSRIFAHYRAPLILSQDPLKVNIRSITDSPYTIRALGKSEGDATTRLQVVAFKKRYLRAILDRDARSDAFCNDILALILNELSLRVQPRPCVGSRPPTLSTDLEEFALRETTPLLATTGLDALRFLYRNRVSLAKAVMFLVGFVLICLGVLNPEQWESTRVGSILVVVSAFMTIWRFVKDRIGR